MELTKNLSRFGAVTTEVTNEVTKAVEATENTTTVAETIT
jgi:hypothetical protein